MPASTTPIIPGPGSQERASTTAELIGRAEELRLEAAKALKSGNYDLAEKTYREAIDCVLIVMDPFHTSYVDMLKGLRTSLSHQDKTAEMTKVDFIIVQLCVSQ